MQRLLPSFLALAAFGAPAHAQSASDAQPAPAPASEPAAPAAPTSDAAPAAEVAPAADPAKVIEAAPPTEPAAAKPEADLPRKLSVGKDSKGATAQLGVLLQGWFIEDFGSTAPDANGDTITRSTLSSFRVRRAEISVSGDLVPKFMKYKVMFDPARVRDTLSTSVAVNSAGMPVTVSSPTSALSVLQDFYLTFQSQYADVSIGQFKIPVSWEGFNSSSKLLLPERAFVANLLGDKRDLGLRVEKTFEKFGYVAGVFNGAGLNNLDNNNQKDVALRLEVYPVKGMTIAGVTYNSIGYRTRAGTKDRFEADFRYETGPFLVQAEYLRAVDTKAAGATSCTNAAGKCTAHGGYAAVAYKLSGLGAGNWKGDLQPVVRVGYYDNDVDGSPSAMTSAEIERMDYEVGLNYYLRKQELKLQLSYDRQQFKNPDGATTRPAVNEVIAGAQVAF